MVSFYILKVYKAKNSVDANKSNNIDDDKKGMTATFMDANKQQNNKTKNRNVHRSVSPTVAKRMNYTNNRDLKKGGGAGGESRQRSAEKEPKKIKTNAEILNGNYTKILKYLNPMHGVRGKKINFYILKNIIEEIYTVRYIKDTSNLKNQMKNKKSEKEIEKDSFPIFVVDFLINKFGKKNLADQVCISIQLPLLFLFLLLSSLLL